MADEEGIVLAILFELAKYEGECSEEMSEWKKEVAEKIKVEPIDGRELYERLPIGIPYEQFKNILGTMETAGLIDLHWRGIYLSGVEITEKGIDYLEENQ